MKYGKTYVLLMGMVTTLFMFGCASQSYNSLPEDPMAVVQVYGKVMKHKADASRTYEPHNNNEIEGRNFYHHLELRLIYPNTHHVKWLTITVKEPIYFDMGIKDKMEKVGKRGTYIKFNVLSGFLTGKYHGLKGNFRPQDIEIVSEENIPSDEKAISLQPVAGGDATR